MRRHLTIPFAFTLIGLLAGIIWGEFQKSPVWPRLSDVVLYRSSASGRAIGLMVGLFISWLVAKREQKITRVGTPSLSRFSFSILTLLATAPVFLWVYVFIPGIGREAFMMRRQSGDLRPNIILITVDALRADHLGAYGSREGLTPAIDAFASESTVYEAVYATSSWTLASLGSVFTGLPPSQSGTKAPVGEREKWYWQHARLRHDTLLLSDKLHAIGYITAFEPTNPNLESVSGWRGFETWSRQMPLNKPGWYFSPKMKGCDVTSDALYWVAHTQREPFLLWLHYMEPHGPYNAPTAPRSLSKRYAKYSAGTEVWEKYKQSKDRKKIADYQSYSHAMYQEEVRYLDSCIGKLLKEIRESGKWNQAMIVITADHGEEFFEHNGIGHGHSMHNEVLRVPLIIKWPQRTRADRRISQVVALPDLGTSLLKIAGIRNTKTLSYPALPQQNAPCGDIVYSESTFWGQEQTALTTDRWRVIYHTTEKLPEKQFEVYDRKHDPLEQRNLVSTGAAKNLCDQLRQMSTSAARIATRRAKSEQRRGKAITLTPERKRQLRSLGYLR